MIFDTCQNLALERCEHERERADATRVPHPKVGAKLIARYGGAGVYICLVDAAPILFTPNGSAPNTSTEYVAGSAVLRKLLSDGEQSPFFGDALQTVQRPRAPMDAFWAGCAREKAICPRISRLGQLAAEGWGSTRFERAKLGEQRYPANEVKKGCRIDFRG
jgi:hypothetical protein